MSIHIYIYIYMIVMMQAKWLDADLLAAGQTIKLTHKQNNQTMTINQLYITIMIVKTANH